MLAGDTFMPEMHLIQAAAFDKPGIIYSACGSFTKNKGRRLKFKKGALKSTYWKIWIKPW